MRAIIEALINAGADPNEHLPLGRTPLMEASRTGNVDAIKVLLDHGADVNAKETLRGTTPLMWAADEGHAPAIQLLIQRGADIKARSNPAERGRGPALGKSNDPRKAGRGARRSAGRWTSRRRHWAQVGAGGWWSRGGRMAWPRPGRQRCCGRCRGRHGPSGFCR